MRRLRYSIATGIAALVLAAGAACANDAGSSEATPAASAPAASPQPTAPSPAATPASPAASVSPRPAPAGVTVSTSTAKYAVGATLKVTVRNGRRVPIYTEDFQTACTIVTLQVSAGGSWTDITGCSMGRPTRTVKIEPGAAKQILLDPHNFHLAEGQGQLGFGAGTYRITFGYRLGAEPMGAQPLSAYSSDFMVG